MTVQTAGMFKNIRYVSDIIPPLKATQVGFKKIGFHVICAVQTVMKKSDLSRI